MYYYKYLKYKRKYINLKKQHAGKINNQTIFSKIISIGYEVEISGVYPLIINETARKLENIPTKLSGKSGIVIDINKFSTPELISSPNILSSNIIFEVGDDDSKLYNFTKEENDNELTIELNDKIYLCDIKPKKKMSHLEIAVTYTKIVQCNDIIEKTYLNSIELIRKFISNNEKATKFNIFDKFGEKLVMDSNAYLYLKNDATNSHTMAFFMYNIFEPNLNSLYFVPQCTIGIKIENVIDLMLTLENLQVKQYVINDKSGCDGQVYYKDQLDKYVYEEMKKCGYTTKINKIGEYEILLDLKKHIDKICKVIPDMNINKKTFLFLSAYRYKNFLNYMSVNEAGTNIGESLYKNYCNIYVRHRYHIKHESYDNTTINPFYNMLDIARIIERYGISKKLNFYVKFSGYIRHLQTSDLILDYEIDNESTLFNFVDDIIFLEIRNFAQQLYLRENPKYISAEKKILGFE